MTGALIAFDWGTTNLRAALLSDDGEVLEERSAMSGVGEFTANQFAAHFDDVTAGWPDVPAIAAGMVGSRQGWHEAAYLPCPVSVDQLSQALYSFSYDGRTITIVPGLEINASHHADVMRGEETQLAGLLSQNPTQSGTVIMPGTHSKWVQLKDGVITTFQTYMTGELFNAISNHTILKHSVTATAGSQDIFAAKAQHIFDNEKSIEGQLFGLRAHQLLNDVDPAELRNELSALLIIAEIRAGEADGFDLNGTITLIGDENLTALYATALEAGGKQSTPLDGTSLIWPALFSLATSAKLIGNAP